MKVLFHCGAGNTDRPERWRTINTLFSDLGESLIQLGHNVYIIIHSSAKIPKNSKTTLNVTMSDDIDSQLIKSINPDVGITWNGNSDGDRKFIDAVGKDKMIYGELGYFGHYNKTCYFDRCGVNTRHSMIGRSFANIVDTEESGAIVEALSAAYIKPRLIPPNEKYIFVPLQDELDTQISQYAPFKTMDSFLHQVFDIFRFDDRPIYYKVHPRSPSRITLKHPRVIEVNADVHHYIPYADIVFGLNSTVMVETLIYHSRLISYGAGITSRQFVSDIDRIGFVANLYRQQLKWDDLKNVDKVKQSKLYDILMQLHIH